MNLESLRAAFVEQAEADAERRRAEIEAECEQLLSEARATASSLVEHGRHEGRLAGEQERARRRGTALRRAREAHLGARGALYRELRDRAGAEALQLRTHPDYELLLDRLAEAAKARLGAEAEIEVDPPDTGGVFARSGRRSVDYTLPALAERAIGELGREVEQLWR